MTAASERNAALTAFITLVRRGNFTRAARDLGISRGHLSDTITELEEKAGVRLLHRNTRRISLTDSGAMLFDRTAKVMDRINEALEDFEANRPMATGTVRLRVNTVIAALLVRRLLNDFLRLNPNIRLDLQIGTIAGPDSDFDASVSNDSPMPGNGGSIALDTPSRNVVFGAPSFLDSHPIPRTPEDLLTYRCVRFRREDGTIANWTFQKGLNRFDLPIKGPVIDDMYQVIEAVLSGFGFGYITFDYCASHVRTGRVIPILEDWSPASSAHVLRWNRHGSLSKPFRALLEYLDTRKIK